MTRSVPSSSRSIRSALPRTLTARGPSAPLNSNVPSSDCSSRRSSTGTSCSISKLKARSPSPGATAEPRRYVRSSARSASPRCASVDSATDVNSSSASASESAVIAAPAALLPAREERLEHFVEQLSALLRAQAGLVVPLFVEAQHARREVLERTREVALDLADRVDLRGARPRRAVVRRRGPPDDRPARSSSHASASARSGVATTRRARACSERSPPAVRSAARSSRAPGETTSPTRSRRPRA